MTIERTPQNLAREVLQRRVLPKVQPKRLREPRPVKRPRDTGPSDKTRAKILERSRLCCERCGLWSPPPVGEIHHRRNRSQGPDNSLPNLCLLCRDCHSWVGARPRDAHQEGFHLEHGDAPELTELMYGGPHVPESGRRRALLLEDGEVQLVEDGWNESEVLL